MDSDFIDSLVLFANEDPNTRQSVLDEMVEWRDAAWAAMRDGKGKSQFEMTSSSQHGKSVSGQIVMTNQQAFTALTNAISRLKTGYLGSITLADFSGMDR